MVLMLAQPITLSLDRATTEAALNRFKTQPLDGYDLFLLEAMDQAGITQVITDDGDYCTVPQIQVFTANQRVLSSAQSQGMLARR